MVVKKTGQNEQLADLAKTVKELVATLEAQTLIKGVVHDKAEAQQMLPVSVSESSTVVDVLLGTTVNTGNYNSVRLQVGLKVPCAVGNEEEVFYTSVAWVRQKLEGMYNQFVEVEGE